MTPTPERLRADTAFGFLDATTASDKIFNPVLISNKYNNTMLRAIRNELRRSTQFIFSVAFITTSALAQLKQELLDYWSRGGRGTIITSTYLDFNTPEMFRELLTLTGIDVFVHPSAAVGFHPKGYVFEQDGTTTAIVGSANLTDRALAENEEWNLRFSAAPGGDIVDQLWHAVDEQLANSRPLTQEWLDDYQRHYLNVRPTSVSSPFDDAPGIELADGFEDYEGLRILPNKMQMEALEAIQRVRDMEERRAVVISATGTGKTILSALDVRQVDPRRMLFVVHREQILDAAMAAYQKVLGVELHELGKFVGARKDLDARYVFATIQSISQPENLARISPDHFDYVLIDEVHRAGAQSYRRLVEHLEPDFLLGLTATPERTDGFNVFELFDHNVPYEIRLQAALEENMLAPFHYYGVTDYVDATGTTVDDTSELSRLVADERVAHLVRALEKYGHAGTVRGLIFCARREEAYELARLLNDASVFGKRLRTRALSGTDPVEERERAVAQLERGELDYILTVDIFNEGIDIPSINQIVMLRQTQSSIIFTQQLGRGLRKWEGKDHLRVIDFIGNYTNNYLIPIALLGDSSLNKDVVRRRFIEAQEAGTLAGLSSINFEEDARERVLRSLSRTRLDSKANLKAAFLELKRRLGRAPKLYDFARFDTVDPVLMATKERDYWTFLASIKEAPFPPPPDIAAVLSMMSTELLNGKRPHELILLQLAFERGVVSPLEYHAELEVWGTRANKETLASVERVLSLEFFRKAEREKYGGQPLVETTAHGYELHSRLRQMLDQNAAFATHFQDLLEAGLFLARHKYDGSGYLQIGEQYTRKDVCRMLNWERNEYSTIYGYKVDERSQTCPIFVTYHKGADVIESIRYGDQFLDPGTLHWYTRSRRTLASSEVRAIVDNAVPLHVFVKKDDEEGADFLYLGRASSTNPVQTQMPGKEGEQLDVVTMDLQLESRVEDGLYRYLLTPSNAV